MQEWRREAKNINFPWSLILTPLGTVDTIPHVDARLPTLVKNSADAELRICRRITLEEIFPTTLLSTLAVLLLVSNNHLSKLETSLVSPQHDSEDGSRFFIYFFTLG